MGLITTSHNRKSGQELAKQNGALNAKYSSGQRAPTSRIIRAGDCYLGFNEAHVACQERGKFKRWLR
jgi:hypothetical protein